MLQREPFSGFTRESILRLDRWYVAHVLFRPRDPKTHALRRVVKVSPLSQREQYLRRLAARGVPRHRAEMAWDDLEGQLYREVQTRRLIRGRKANADSGRLRGGAGQSDAPVS